MIKTMCVLVSCVLLVSCTKTPSKTVAAYIDAARSQDRPALLRLVQEKDREYLEKMEGKLAGQKGLMAPEGARFRIGGEKVDGDRATVEVTTIRDGQETTDLLKLVREDGQWRIDLIPDEMLRMVEGMEGVLKGAEGSARSPAPPKAGTRK